MRRSLTASALALLLASCVPERERETLSEVAQELFSAAAVGDSARLRELMADTLVINDLAVIAAEQPGLIEVAARGVEPRRGGEISRDSAYLFLETTNDDRSYQVDVGFTRRQAAWRVYYVGLTGNDLRGRRRTE